MRVRPDLCAEQLQMGGIEDADRVRLEAGLTAVKQQRDVVVAAVGEVTEGGLHVGQEAQSRLVLGVRVAVYLGVKPGPEEEQAGRFVRRHVQHVQRNCLALLQGPEGSNGVKRYLQDAGQAVTGG